MNNTEKKFLHALDQLLHEYNAVLGLSRSPNDGCFVCVAGFKDTKRTVVIEALSKGVEGCTLQGGFMDD